MNFDVDKELEKLECPNMFKAGLKYYIQSNKLQPKNKKELDKIVTDFSKVKMGD